MDDQSSDEGSFSGFIHLTIQKERRNREAYKMNPGLFLLMRQRSREPAETHLLPGEFPRIILCLIDVVHFLEILLADALAREWKSTYDLSPTHCSLLIMVEVGLSLNVLSFKLA